MKLLSDSRRLRKFIIWLEGLRALEAAGQAARGGRRGATEGGPRLREPSRQPRRSGFRERARKPESSGRCLGRGYCCLRPSLQSLLRPRLLVCARPRLQALAQRRESVPSRHLNVTVWKPGALAVWREVGSRKSPTIITFMV